MIPLLHELRQANAVEAAIFLTYSLDLPWFERLVLAPLRARGARRVLVLADAFQLSRHVRTDFASLRGAGRSYLIQGVATYAHFHPKAMLLAGGGAARLYVGSGNLNRRGLSGNLEVFESWTAERTDERIPHAFTEFETFLSRIIREANLHALPVGEEVLNIVNATLDAGGLRRKANASTQATLAGSPGSLWSQLPAPGSTKTKRVTFLSPFFDEEAALARQMRTLAGSGALTVITDIRTTNLTRSAVTKIRAVGGRVRLLTDEPRPLHAKAVLVGNKSTGFSVTGSANCTNAAWHGHNCELVTIRNNEAAIEVRKLVEALATCDLTDDDLAILDAREAKAKAEEDDEGLSGHPLLLCAKWRAGQELDVHFRSRGKLPSEVLLHGSSHHRVSLQDDGDGGAEFITSTLRTPADVRSGSALVVQLVTEGEPGNAVVVQDLAEIREHATGRMEAEEVVEQLLGGSGDLEGAERLLTLLATIAEDNAPTLTKAGHQEQGKDQGTRTPTSKYVVSEADYERDAEDYSSESGRSGASSYPVGARLISRLLFGQQADLEDADAAEGESKSSDDGNDDSDGDGDGDGNPAPKPQGASDRPRASLLEAADKARQAYIAAFRSMTDGRSAWRLNRDLQVLLATLHFLLRNGLRPHDFTTQLAPLLRAFLGHPHAPLPRSLSTLTGDERRDAWSRYHFLLNAALFIYNAALADAEARRLEQDEIDDDMPHIKPVLWLRHIVRHAPEESVQNLLDTVDVKLPSIRQGAFWVAEHVPRAGDQVPFPTFLRRVVGDAQSLNSASDELRSIVRARSKSAPIDDAELVVGIGQGDQLISGFAESGANDRMYGIMYQEAFVGADPRPIEVRMLRYEAHKIMPLDELQPNSEAASRGIDVLRRIAES